jgi:hypothetical protein
MDECAWCFTSNVYAVRQCALRALMLYSSAVYAVREWSLALASWARLHIVNDPRKKA